MLANTIEIGGYLFFGPYFYNKEFKDDFSCVYVLLNNQNQVVDVGETESIKDRISNHERKMCWIENGCVGLNLYLYISTDKLFRLSLEKLIRSKYNPYCGKK